MTLTETRATSSQITTLMSRGEACGCAPWRRRTQAERTAYAAGMSRRDAATVIGRYACPYCARPRSTLTRYRWAYLERRGGRDFQRMVPVGGCDHAHKSIDAAQRCAPADVDVVIVSLVTGEPVDPADRRPSTAEQIQVLADRAGRCHCRKSRRVRRAGMVRTYLAGLSAREASDIIRVDKCPFHAGPAY